MNTCFAYFVARLCIQDQDSCTTAIKWICLALVPLTLLGAVESSTGWQPYLTMTRYCPWSPSEMLLNPRSGFFRALGAFGHPIMFGSAFVLFLPLVYNLRHETGNWQTLAYLVSVAAIIGALASMSSGPWVSVIFAIICMAMERFKNWLKLVLMGFVFSCIFIGIASNRPIYHVIISYANPIGGAGWHRAKLIDLAIEHFGEWWLIGYGDKDPGWGESLGMGFTDVTNEFVFAGVQYGFLGVIALCGVLATAIRQLSRLHNSSTDPRLKSLAWALGSAIVTVIFIFMSVAFFGQMIPLFYSVLGIIGSSFSFRPGSVELQRHEAFPITAECVSS